MARALLALSALLLAVSGVIVTGAVTQGDARAQSIVADLSHRQIDISTGFSGEELLLFGATEGEGDIVVTVTGPSRNEVVRRKERVAGIWVNGASVTFLEAPAYYRVAASRPLEDIAPPSVLAALQLGKERLDLFTRDGRPGTEILAFREALIRNKQRADLYGEDISKIQITGGRLFRTDIPFPANVPTGEYLVHVYLFKNGVLVSQEETPLTVRKAGLEAQIYSFAHDHAPWYGAIAIALALLAGWLAGVIFRRT